jgi:hypothetical protein
MTRKHSESGVTALCALVLLGFVALDVTDLINYARDPESYHIGAEAMGFRYRSEAQLVYCSLAHIVPALIAIGAPWVVPRLRQDPDRALQIRGYTCLFLVLQTFYLTQCV